MRGRRPPVRDAFGEASRAEIDDARQRATRDRTRLQGVGDDLARRLGGTWSTRVIDRPWGEGVVLEMSQVACVMELHVDGEKVAVRMLGDPEPSVWVCGSVVDDAELEAIASCVDVTRARLTVDRLQPGARYRVSVDTQGLRAGAIVRFVTFDDVDNHFGRLVLEGELGERIVVEGDFSSERSPVAQVHRYLARVV